MISIFDFIKSSADEKKIIFKKITNVATRVHAKAYQIQEAKDAAEELGNLPTSISCGKGNFIGMLGQIIVRDYINGVNTDDEHNYDVISPDGLRVEVKTSGTFHTDLKSDYWNRVNCKNLRQRCNVYAFCAINEKTMDVWICGYMWKEDFMAMSTLFKAGFKVPNTGVIMRAPSMNVQTSELLSIDCLKDESVPIHASTGKKNRKGHSRGKRN